MKHVVPKPQGSKDKTAIKITTPYIEYLTWSAFALFFFLLARVYQPDIQAPQPSALAWVETRRSDSSYSYCALTPEGFFLFFSFRESSQGFCFCPVEVSVVLDLAGHDVEGEGPARRQAGKSFQRLVSILRIKVINHSVHFLALQRSCPSSLFKFEISEAVSYSALGLMQCNHGAVY